MTANVDIYVDRFAAHEKRLDAVEAHQRTMAKREIVQFVVGVLVIISSIFGAGNFLSWQNAKLVEQLEKRIEQNERNFNARIDALEKSTNARFDDLIARFDDLKQVVHSQKR